MANDALCLAGLQCLCPPMSQLSPPASASSSPTKAPKPVKQKQKQPPRQRCPKDPDIKRALEDCDLLWLQDSLQASRSKRVTLTPAQQKAVNHVEKNRLPLIHKTYIKVPPKPEGSQVLEVRILRVHIKKGRAWTPGEKNRNRIFPSAELVDPVSLRRYKAGSNGVFPSLPLEVAPCDDIRWFVDVGEGPPGLDAPGRCFLLVDKMLKDTGDSGAYTATLLERGDCLNLDKTVGELTIGARWCSSADSPMPPPKGIPASAWFFGEDGEDPGAYWQRILRHGPQTLCNDLHPSLLILKPPSPEVCRGLEVRVLKWELPSGGGVWTSKGCLRQEGAESGSEAHPFVLTAVSLTQSGVGWCLEGDADGVLPMLPLDSPVCAGRDKGIVEIAGSMEGANLRGRCFLKVDDSKGDSVHDGCHQITAYNERGSTPVGQLLLGTRWLVEQGTPTSPRRAEASNEPVDPKRALIMLGPPPTHDLVGLEINIHRVFFSGKEQIWTSSDPERSQFELQAAVKMFEEPNQEQSSKTIEAADGIIPLLPPTSPLCQRSARATLELSGCGGHTGRCYVVVDDSHTAARSKSFEVQLVEQADQPKRFVGELSVTTRWRLPGDAPSPRPLSNPFEDDESGGSTRRRTTSAGGDNGGGVFELDRANLKLAPAPANCVGLEVKMLKVDFSWLSSGWLWSSTELQNSTFTPVATVINPGSRQEWKAQSDGVFPLLPHELSSGSDYIVDISDGSGFAGRCFLAVEPSFAGGPSKQEHPALLVDQSDAPSKPVGEVVISTRWRLSGDSSMTSSLAGDASPSPLEASNKEAGKHLDSNSYIDNWGKKFTVEHNMRSVKFLYGGVLKSGTLTGELLQIPGWHDGTVQPDGNVYFTDGGKWTKTGCKILDGNNYEDNWGKKFTVQQCGFGVELWYNGRHREGTLNGDILKIHGWHEGTVKADGNVEFVDEGKWIKKAYKIMDGKSYKDNWGNSFSVEQHGFLVKFMYEEKLLTGTLSGDILKIPGWAIGTVREDGNLRFSDGGEWTRKVAKVAKAPENEQTKTFDAMDTNHDGVITREEFKAFGKRQARAVSSSSSSPDAVDGLFTPVQIVDTFDAMDTNRDGVITREEFQSFARRQVGTAADPEPTFQEYDRIRGHILLSPPFPDEVCGLELQVIRLAVGGQLWTTFGNSNGQTPPRVILSEPPEDETGSARQWKAGNDGSFPVILLDNGDPVWNLEILTKDTTYCCFVVVDPNPEVEPAEKAKAHTSLILESPSGEDDPSEIWYQVGKYLDGVYEDNWGNVFTATQDGFTVNFTYEGKLTTGMLSGETLKISGWHDGTVQRDGDVKFADGGMWTKKVKRRAVGEVTVRARWVPLDE